LQWPNGMGRGNNTANELHFQVSQLGAPPLPLFEEAASLLTFFTDSLDDFVEDSVTV
jgi:hypothetical protein